MQSTARRAAIGGGVAAVVLVGGGLASFFSGSAPDEIAIDDALASADGSATAPDTTDEPQATEPVDPQGTWAVDTEAQPYDFDASTGTFVGFRVDEELSSVGSTTAVGRTPEVDGRFTIDGTSLTEASFTADLSQLSTDDGRRDNKTRSALGVTENPDATFTLTEPVDLGGQPAVGETLTATATGELTVNGVTDTVDVPLEAALSESGVFVVTGSFDVLLSDHEVVAPSAPIVLSVSDTATVEVQLYLTKAS